MFDANVWRVFPMMIIIWSVRLRAPRLQEEQFIGEFFCDGTLDVHSYQIREFVSVLARRGNSHCSRPIVVQEAKLVSQTLQDVSFEVVFVVYDDVMRWCCGAFTDVLRDNVEVVQGAAGDCVIQNRTGWWIDQAVFSWFACCHEELCVDSLLNDHECQLRCVLRIDALELWNRKKSTYCGKT